MEARELIGPPTRKLSPRGTCRQRDWSMLEHHHTWCAVLDEWAASSGFKNAIHEDGGSRFLQNIIVCDSQRWKSYVPLKHCAVPNYMELQHRILYCSQWEPKVLVIVCTYVLGCTVMDSCVLNCIFNKCCMFQNVTGKQSTTWNTSLEKCCSSSNGHHSLQAHYIMNIYTLWATRNTYQNL
jgi:hypothetical protein